MLSTTNYIPEDCPKDVTPITGTYFMNAVITNTKFDKSTDISKSTFMNAVLFNVEFNGCDLKHTDFMNARFIGCKFVECEMDSKNTDFMNCVFINTRFDDYGYAADCMNIKVLDSNYPKGGNTMNRIIFRSYAELFAYHTQTGSHYLDFISSEFEELINLKMLVDLK